MSNSAVFASFATEIDNIDSCAQLQASVDRLFGMLTAQYTSILAQQAILAPIAALLSAPANPTAAVTWIGNFITDVLGPQYAGYTQLLTQEADLVAAVASITTAINNAASRIGSCSITIPPL